MKDNLIYKLGVVKAITFFILLLSTFNMHAQAHVEFKISKKNHKIDNSNGSEGTIGIDVFAFGDYDGAGVVNSANIIIDSEALDISNYQIHKWESCVSTSGNGITYSPNPLNNPILNFACLKGVENGQRIGTLWLSKIEDSSAETTKNIDLQVRFNDLFFHSKVDGVKIDENSELEIKLDSSLEVAVYPNPIVNDKIGFILKREVEPEIFEDTYVLNAELSNVLGKVQRIYKNMEVKVNTYQEIEIPEIASGQYNLTFILKNGKTLQSIPIIKAN